MQTSRKRGTEEKKQMAWGFLVVGERKEDAPRLGPSEKAGKGSSLSQW